MEKEIKNKFGLLGKDISYSFSEGYFKEKFKREGLKNYSYENFDLENINAFKDLLKTHNALSGINVTIPYKELVIPFLDHLDPTAKAIGAVNTIKVGVQGLTGYNTDVIGFKNSIVSILNTSHKKALILGTGGASKAVAYVFNELGIPFKFVSRNPSENQLAYTDLNATIMKTHQIIVNCSPLGTFPNVHEKADIPYQFITKDHVAYDLIYNPEITAFLKAAIENGAKIKNGYDMLVGQAEASWNIWMHSHK